MSDNKLPVIVGKNMKKGIFAYRGGIYKNPGKGLNVWIVLLKKKYKTGQEYELKDIKAIDTAIHFCDKESVEIMVNILQKYLNDWEGKNEN